MLSAHRSGSASKNGHWEDEMIALETQLNASVRMQIENTRDGIRRLGESQDRLLGGVGEALGEALSLCKTSEGLVANYPTVKQVSKTFQNFRLVNAVYDQFETLNETVERTAQLLEQDKAAGESENLLLVFYHLSRLEAFRTQTLNLMKDGPSTSIYTLKRYFKRLDDLSAEFEAFYWELPKNFFLMAIEGQQKVIVRVLKVLTRMNGYPGGVEGAQVRLFKILEDDIAEKFQASMSMLGGNVWEDIEGALQSVSFWLGDLSTIRSGIAPCFPPSFCILNFYTQTYHRHIQKILEQCITLPDGRKHEVADVLFILRWVKDYTDQMTMDIGFSPEDLDVRLFDERQESKLIGEYLTMSRVKIVEWIGNLFEGEKTNFVERPSEPDVDANNFYLSPAAVDLIQIIKQNIMTTSESSRGKLVLEIITEICKSVADFQKKLGALIESETSKYLSDKNPPPAEDWFESYIIMMGNTGLRWATSLQTEIVEVLESLVASEYLAAATKQLKALGDGFINISKIASLALCKIIFHSLAPAIQQLFTIPAWYGGEPLVNTIVITLGDFLGDYKVHCEDFLFNKLVADLLETFILTYLRQLKVKSTKLRMADCHDYFGEDLTAITEYFSTLRDPRRVQKVIEGLDKFVDLITASTKVIYLEFFSFWKIFPDMPISFLEEVLAKRDDLDRSTIKEIIETCKKKTQEEKPADIQPSLFSKL